MYNRALLKYVYLNFLYYSTKETRGKVLDMVTVFVTTVIFISWNKNNQFC